MITKVRSMFGREADLVASLDLRQRLLLSGLMESPLRISASKEFPSASRLWIKKMADIVKVSRLRIWK